MNTETDKYSDIAGRWADDMNKFTFNGQLLCVQFALREHKTLQQTFTRVCLAWIKTCACDKYRYDGRNEASHKLCKDIVETMQAKNPDWDALPFI